MAECLSEATQPCISTQERSGYRVGVSEQRTTTQPLRHQRVTQLRVAVTEVSCGSTTAAVVPWQLIARAYVGRAMSGVTPERTKVTTPSMRVCGIAVVSRSTLSGEKRGTVRVPGWAPDTPPNGGIPGGPPGPPRTPGGVHFGGYLITLPVGTKFWTIFGPPGTGGRKGSPRGTPQKGVPGVVPTPIRVLLGPPMGTNGNQRPTHSIRVPPYTVLVSSLSLSVIALGCPPNHTGALARSATMRSMGRMTMEMAATVPLAPLQR